MNIDFTTGFLKRLNSLPEETKQLGLFRLLEVMSVFGASKAESMAPKMHAIASKKRPASRHPDRDFVIMVWQQGKFDSIESFATEMQNYLQVKASKISIRKWIKADCKESKPSAR